MDLKQEILDLKSAGRNHSQIASMLMIHKQDVDIIVSGGDVNFDFSKKTVADEVRFKAPKIKKLSEITEEE